MSESFLNTPDSLTSLTKGAFEQLYLHWTTPEFRHSIDDAVETLRNAEKPVLVVVSSGFYAIEVLRRYPGLLHLAGNPGFNLDEWLSQGNGWISSAVTEVTLASAERYPAILWAEPEIATAEIVASLLQKCAGPGARLSVIATTPLRRFLPDYQGSYPPAQSPQPALVLPHILRSTGWKVDRCVGYHGPRSILWINTMRLFNQLGRPDLADRAWFAARQTYREKGLWWNLSPLALIHAHLA